MSLKSSLWRYLGLLAVAALAVGVFAGPASAKKMSAKQRAAVRAQLKKQIKKNPALINKRSFIKRASLANFRLPVTVALRTGDKPATPAREDATANPNSASIDLGTSLGNRSVNLGGSLKAVIQFHDSYDGGALGNVDLEILPSAHALTSTSIPLLWNSQVTAAGTRWDANALGLESLAGCSTFTGTAALPFAAGLAASGAVNGIPQPGGLPGYPYYADLAAAQAGTPSGFLPQKPGVDAIDRLVASKQPGNNDALGENPDPFPTLVSASDPGVSGSTGQPNIQQTVLRTNALKLGVAAAGTESANPATQSGAEGTQNIKMGKSGGQANLFGNIPGKPYGIDVTVNLETKINSILRIVDQDTTGAPLLTGDHYPAGIFGCRQVYTGAVQNYIPAVHLKGSLKIAPAVTAKGNLRIAKATLSGLGTDPARFAVAACLVPYAPYTAANGTADADGGAIPGPAAGPSSPLAEDSQMPADVFNTRATPENANCNDTPTGIVKNSALTGYTVNSITGGSVTDGTEGVTTGNGSKVTVAADLKVTNVSADILIGDVTE